MLTVFLIKFYLVPNFAYFYYHKIHLIVIANAVSPYQMTVFNI